MAGRGVGVAVAGVVAGRGVGEDGGTVGVAALGVDADVMVTATVDATVGSSMAVVPAPAPVAMSVALDAAVAVTVGVSSAGGSGVPVGDALGAVVLNATATVGVSRGDAEVGLSRTAMMMTKIRAASKSVEMAAEITRKDAEYTNPIPSRPVVDSDARRRS